MPREEAAWIFKHDLIVRRHYKWTKIIKSPLKLISFILWHCTLFIWVWLTPCDLHVPQSELSVSRAKLMSCEASDTAALTQDNIPLSEMDKAEVLTLIREEVCRCHTPTAADTWWLFIYSLFMSCLPIRSSLKRLKSMSGRENTRSAKRRFLRWGLTY